jgi:hypothetical protein
MLPLSFATASAADNILEYAEFGLDMRLTGVSNSNTWNKNKKHYARIFFEILSKTTKDDKRASLWA